MRVHHLNCGTMCPLLGGLVAVDEMICHCLLIETPGSGLVLVDTGFGLGDIAEPKAHLGPFVTIGRPRLDPAETAVRQIEALGFSPTDVRHLVLTHLDLDHAGGLGDFPHAQVHLMRAERDAAANPRTLSERERYRPVQWAHDPEWVLHDPGAGEPWYGFGCVRDLAGVPPEILLVPLGGHSRGHAGVAIQANGRWLLHAGDAYFFRGEMAPRPRCPPGLRLFQTLAQVSRRDRLQNQQRLRDLVRDHAADVTVFSAHDTVELDQLSAARR